MTTANDSSDATEAKWRQGPRVVGAAIGISFVSIQIALEQFGGGGIAEWSFGALSGVAGAAFLMRSYRARPWYWPSIVGIALAEILLIVAQGQSGLATHLEKGLMAIAMLSAASTGGFLLWMRWLSDRPKKPRSTAALTVEIVIYGFAAIFIALAGFLYWAAQGSTQEDPAVWQVVLARPSVVPMRDLLECLAPTGSRRHIWEDIAGTRRVERSYDFGRGVRTVVSDEGADRRVEFATRHGHAMTPAEVSEAERCLTLPI
ncbi:hypothetical protein QH494_02895 [Sphingomonas sp. AR_OL41]|uniref:hypothetical protein n=1 Tax=Sphingomonas sp. AR_OL41 TaxID=3042729 RepID=UPI00248025D1|nr:hypothetical protein [Sphingomonas sp. AR_OL41]MDH7971117.1 hypothetical protein [Sphingomonas sp. AR_OL41]